MNRNTTSGQLSESDWVRRFEAVEPRIAHGIETHRKSQVTLRVLDGEGRALTGERIQVEQTSHAFLFGCNVFVLGQLATDALNERYEQAVLRICNQVTLPLYWSDLEPEEGQLRFASDSPYMWRRPPVDDLVAWGRARDLVLKGHPLVWHLWYPEWAKRDGNEVKRLLRKRLTEIAERYGQDIRLWDGVNESLKMGNILRDTLGQEYVQWCLKLERELFGDATLTLNESTHYCHNTLPPDEIYMPYQQQIEQLLAAETPIDVIGFQYHIRPDILSDYVTGDHPTGRPEFLLDWYGRFERFARPMHVTEVTLPGSTDLGVSPALQARMVRDLYRLWFSSPSMRCITYWNLGDQTATDWENRMAGGLLDENMRPKPAFEALDALINDEWRTRMTAVSDEQGRVEMGGFHGTYRVFDERGRNGTFELASAAAPAPVEVQLQ